MTDAVILVVEDEPDHRELIVTALAKRCDPARITAVGDGAAALDYLHARGAFGGRDARKMPRLIILDLHMAPVDGLAFLDEVRAEPRTSGIPVVMLSATSDRAAVERCYTAGANSVVRKTADFDDLAKKMSSVYDFWITVNEANRPSRV